VVQVQDIVKKFGNFNAINGVSLEVYSGEVHALLGDNGAGKSTLIKLISGVHRANAGEIYLADQQVAFETPRESRDAGIEVIYQDMALVNELEVWENVFLGRLLRNSFGIIERKRMIEEAAHLLERLDLHALSPTTKVGYLSGGQKKGVAISRALYWDTRLIFMDEPTAALAVFEISKVLEQIETMRQGGVAVVFVSHNLKEVLSTADRVMVLHRGQLTGIRNAKETSEDEVIRLMMGTA